MADHCGICDTRRPEGGTKILVLNGGALFDKSSESSTPKGDEPPLDDTLLLDAFRDTSDDWDDEDDFNRSWAEWEAIKAEEQRMERLDAPTWYEMLGEFILGRKQRTPHNLRV